MGRTGDLDRLYTLLARCDAELGGPRTLANCDGYMDWPDRGVYFFFAPAEPRTDSDQRRLTRIGTHAVSAGSQTSLWNRLRTHRGATRGTYEGGGNHRGSVFRRHVGAALIERDGLHDDYPQWGEGSNAGRERRLAELELERQVSDFIRELPFVWVGIDDQPGPDSDRTYVERNAIALVSNYESAPIDPRRDDWLGRHSPAPEIRESGLWNVNHVDEAYDPAFLDTLEGYLDGSPASHAPAPRAASEEDPEADATDPPTEATASEDDPDGASDGTTESFAPVWEDLLVYAEAEEYVATLSRGNRNEIRRGVDAIEVRNLDTDEWRTIDRADFAYAYQVLQDEGELTLDAIEPELAGRKSMVTAILTRALDLEYDSRPLTVYF
jgi:hypothetical protein